MNADALLRIGDGRARASWSSRRPAPPVEVRFESELGQRLEAALLVAERCVEVIELAYPALRHAVEEMVAGLPNGVRSPQLVELLEPTSPAARPVIDRAAIAPDPSWRPWEAFVEPLVAADHEGETEAMAATNTHRFRGQDLTIAELLEHESAAPGLNKNALRMRITKGWDVERALTVPMGAPRGTGPSSKPPPATKAAKPRRAPAAKSTLAQEARVAVRAAAASLDPIALLSRLGIAHEDLGATPKGRLVLLTEASV